MAKTKSKVKFDLKGFLLKKGEYLAMGIAGFFLFLLMVWGITKWTGAEDPIKINKDMTQKASQIQSAIGNSEVTEADKSDAVVPEWARPGAEITFKTVPSSDFALTVPQFDPTAKPDTKKENPNVLRMGTYQVDLVRGSMKGFDIVQGTEGEQMIAVIYNKKVDPQDLSKVNDLSLIHI